MEYPSLSVTHWRADLSDMFVLTGLILVLVPRLLARALGVVRPAAPVRRADDASTTAARTLHYPLASIHAPPPRLIV